MVTVIIYLKLTACVAANSVSNITALGVSSPAPPPPLSSPSSETPSSSSSNDASKNSKSDD